MKAFERRERVAAWIVSAFLILLFISIVGFLREFKLETARFEQKGFWLVLYHTCRVAFAFYLTILCYCAGYRTIQIFRVNPLQVFNGVRKTFILCFFLGASLYGIAFAVLGLAGLVSLSSALALTIPVLLFAYRPLIELLPERWETAKVAASADTHASPFFAWMVIVIAITAALLFLVTRVVFIPNMDSNIWEHYLHYYRAVLASGSTQPNEVWHHFYNSKGGGLVFLANVLSDFFSVQLVSACFVAVTGLIILDLLLEHCRSVSWAFFGVTLFLAFLFGDVSSGAMFRVHGVLLGYASFALWGSVYLLHPSSRELRPLMAGLVISLAYLGFYLPVATAIFPLAFLLIALTNGLLHKRTGLKLYLSLACAVTGGTALALLTNWVLTGLPEVTPMRWFWAIADRVKVEEVFGTGGVEFFLAVNNDLAQNEPWYRRLVSTMRYPLPKAFLFLTVLGAFVLPTKMFAQYRATGTVAEADRFLVQLAAFLIPLGVFALLVPSPSVFRMGLYSVVFFTLANVVIWKRITDIYLEGVRFSLLSVESNDSGALVHRKFRLWHGATVLSIGCGMVAVFMQASESMRGQGSIIYEFARGSISMKETLQRMESRAVRPRGISVAAISDFRNTNPGNGRILSLVYDPGYSYLLPGDGIISEPTYSFSGSPAKILAMEPREVMNYLRDRNFEYFALNLQERLFTTIAFTSIFSPREMPQYLSVAYKDGDFFILTWRQGEESKLPPEYLLTLFELKRTGILHYPFTERFATLLAGGNQLVDSVVGFENTRHAFRKELEEVLNAEALRLLSSDTSKNVLHRVFDAGKNNVGSVDPGTLLNIRRGASGHLKIRISERDVRTRLLALFRDAIYKEYIAEFGSELASLSLRCDERVPFAMNYPADATCH